MGYTQDSRDALDRARQANTSDDPKFWLFAALIYATLEVAVAIRELSQQVRNK